MIELINDYYIQVNSLCYILLKKTGTDKNGNPTYKTCAYLGSIKSCIERCIDLVQKDKLSQDIFTLTEALKIVKDTQNEFKSLLEEINV